MGKIFKGKGLIIFKLTLIEKKTRDNLISLNKIIFKHEASS